MIPRGCFCTNQKKEGLILVERNLLLSVLGDSISTFEGFQPESFKIFYNREKQAKNGIKNVYDM